MLYTIPKPVLSRMQELEARDREDRVDGTSHQDRLRQVPPETGRFLAFMAAAAPVGSWVEIGTSGGYSALWLSLACRETGGKLTTFEILPEKAEIARETLRLAKIDEFVNLVEGDGLAGVGKFDTLSFCFLDADKARAAAYCEAIFPRLVPGGLLLMDNAISHESILTETLRHVSADPRLDSLVLSIGKGVLVCRKRGS